MVTPAKGGELLVWSSAVIPLPLSHLPLAYHGSLPLSLLTAPSVLRATQTPRKAYCARLCPVSRRGVFCPRFPSLPGVQANG